MFDLLYLLDLLVFYLFKSALKTIDFFPCLRCGRVFANNWCFRFDYTDDNRFCWVLAPLIKVSSLLILYIRINDGLFHHLHTLWNLLLNSYHTYVLTLTAILCFMKTRHKKELVYKLGMTFTVGEFIVFEDWGTLVVNISLNLSNVFFIWKVKFSLTLYTWEIVVLIFLFGVIFQCDRSFFLS